MSQKLETFQAYRGRPPEYPWHEWMDGPWEEGSEVPGKRGSTPIQLIKGEDYTCANKSLRTLLHRTAKNVHGVRVSTRIAKDGSSIDVEFHA